MTNFALDRPQVIEAPLESTTTYRLANQDVVFQADPRANLSNFFWPWADSIYAKSISITLSAPREDEFVPIIAQLHPGFLETIIGTSSMDGGIIVSKQLTAPLGSSYDRSAIWLLDCQAEGDRLLQVDVEIDWGEPLNQRMVDGLLVAQSNPGPAQGIYDQHNADSTRVFGNPEGRPHVVNIDDPQRAHLSYYVLINGEIEFQFLFTVSDVGEQVAWNGFLALRDAIKVTEKSGNAWRNHLKAGRLWTPNPDLNFLLNASKIAAIQSMTRLRSGMTPAERSVTDAPSLIEAWDIFDPVQSRNLLAHLRRLVEKTNGRLPKQFPLRRIDKSEDPGVAVCATNAAYLNGVANHLTRVADVELLDAHYPAIGLCAEMLMRHQADSSFEACSGLKAAVHLAQLKGDETNRERWQNALGLNRFSEPAHETGLGIAPQMGLLAEQLGWKPNADGVWCYSDSSAAANLVGQAIWHYAGLALNRRPIQVNPNWHNAQTDCWPWWALMDLPLNEETTLSLVWDGQTLHANQPIQTTLPTAMHDAIQTTGTDADSFALEFVFIDQTEDNEVTKTSFKPELDHSH